MDFSLDSIWGSVSESVGEAWDIATDYGESLLADEVTKLKEEGRDPDQVKAKEPLKGTRADGSPIVVEPTSSQLPAGAQANQLIKGVDNTVLLVGGVILLVVLLGRGK